MSRKTIYFQHSFLFFIFLVILLFGVLTLVFIGAVSIAFQNVGFTPLTIFFILVGTLIGSFINIPLLKLRTKVPVIHDESVSWFGVNYRIPQVEYGESITQVAVNVGGALIQTGVSIYLLAKSSASMIILSLIGVFAVAPGNPLSSQTSQRRGNSHTSLHSANSRSSSRIDSLANITKNNRLRRRHPRNSLGADLLNLHKIPKLGAPVTSIGGARTFDGVFLSGIIAVLLAGI